MTKLLRYALILFSLFLTTLVVADHRVVGHMPPFPKERLASPMHLKCGLTIHEWRGTNIDRARAEKICALAIKNFVPFLKTKGLKPDHDEPFEWPAALMPDGACYRCMNDVKYRFYVRPYKGYATGYTSYTQNWMFMVGNSKRGDFDVTLAHELFHAMSDHYGILDHYPTQEQVEENEVLAVQFTQHLGLGR
jgi:hypothetical protein